MLTKLQALGSQSSQILFHLIQERFKSTGDEILAELCFTLTPQGLLSFRSKYQLFITNDQPKLNPTPEDLQLYQRFEAIIQKFKEISKHFGLFSDDTGLLFRYYLEHFNFSDDLLTNEWKKFSYVIHSSYQHHENKSFKPDTIGNFIKCALILINFPSSEAVAERCFSQL